MIPETGTSFPVGLAALLVIILFTISGLFVHCCNTKTRLSQPSSRPNAAAEADSAAGSGSQSGDSLSHSITMEKDEIFAVVMAGEEAPRYLAVPAPRTNI